MAEHPGVTAAATTEIEELSVLFSAYCSEQVEHVRMEDSNGSTSVGLRRKSPLAVRLLARTGMVINELRACLDALACVLAMRNGNDTRDVYFPISKSKDIFESDGFRKIKKLSSADQDKIIKLQPYREAN